MRRTIRYTAGLVIVAGATFAFAGPAAAGPKPFTPGSLGSGSYPGGVNVSNQVAVPVNVVLNNIGNPQIGNHNTNGGGSASAGIWSGQFSGTYFD